VAPGVRIAPGGTRYTFHHKQNEQYGYGQQEHDH